MYRKIRFAASLVMLLCCLLFAGVAMASVSSPTTDEEFIQALQQQSISQPSSFTITLNQAYYDNLMARPGALDAVLADGGITKYHFTRYSSGRFEFDSVTWHIGPYAVLNSLDDMFIYLCTMRTRGETNFACRVPLSIVETYKTDTFYNMAARAGIFDISCMTYFSATGLTMFERVQWPTGEWMVSATEEHLVACMDRMRAMNQKSFDIVLTEELYSKLSANDFKRLGQLESKAFINSRSMSYYSSQKHLVYTNVNYAQQAVQLNNMAEVLDFIDQACKRLDDSIALYASPELCRQLMTKRKLSDTVNATPLNDLLDNCGVDDWRYIDKSDAGCILVQEIKYMTGFRVARAAALGRTNELNSQEMQLLNTARQLANTAAAKGSKLDVALAVSQSICSRCDYDDSMRRANSHSAVGSLIDGIAVCDGYAEAFYLVGSLAGLDVRFQHGDSRDKNENSDTSHMWNLVNIGGTWRMVDVTWMDDDEFPNTVYFNLGEDRASLTHVWHRDLTVPLAPTTDRNQRPDPEFYVTNTQELNQAIQEACRRKLTMFHVFVTPGMAKDMDLLEKALHRNGYNDNYSTIWRKMLTCITYCDVTW